MLKLAQILHLRIAAVAPIIGVTIGDPDDKVTWIVDYLPEATTEQRSAAQQIIDQFDLAAATAEETAALADFANSIASFNAIPDWATLPVSELISAANAGFFNGEDETVVRNRIDTQVTTNIVTVRGALKDIVAELYKAHGREIKIIQSVGYLRDYLIRLRRQASGQLSPTRD